MFHRKLWPAVMELTNGKPKLKAGQMIVDDPKLGVGNVKGNGGHLHCAREDWGPESASFEVMQGEIRANDFIVFICALSRSLCIEPQSVPAAFLLYIRGGCFFYVSVWSRSH